MTSTRRRVGALLVGLWALPVLAQEQEEPPTPQQQLSQLRNINNNSPLTLEDALPQNPGPQGQLSFTSGDEESGQDGLLLVPQVTYGLWERLELRVQMPLGRLEGQTELGPVQGQVLGLLAPEGELRPAVSLRGTLTAPSQDEPLSGQLAALATKTFGRYRMHVNAGYQLQRGEAGRTLLGLAGDRALSTHVLLLGETFLERQQDESRTRVGADVGSAWRLGQHVQLYGTVGLRRVGTDVDPWVLLGVQGS